MAEGADRIVEEHHAVARDEEVEPGFLRRPARGIADLEAQPVAIQRPLPGDGDQGGRKIDAGDPGLGQRVRQSEAGRPRAAADVEDLGRLGRARASDRGGDERLVDGRKRAVGAAPFLGPDLAISAPVVRGGHVAPLPRRPPNGTCPQRTTWAERGPQSRRRIRCQRATRPACRAGPSSCC